MPSPFTKTQENMGAHTSTLQRYQGIRRLCSKLISVLKRLAAVIRQGQWNPNVYWSFFRVPDEANVQALNHTKKMRKIILTKDREIPMFWTGRCTQEFSLFLSRYPFSECPSHLRMHLPPNAVDREHGEPSDTSVSHRWILVRIGSLARDAKRPIVPGLRAACIVTRRF